MYRNETYVTIRWAWLVLLGILVVLLVVLHVAAIIETQRHRVGVWKDSPLALLLHTQLESGAKPTDMNAGASNQIQKAVKGLGAIFVQHTEEEYKSMEMHIEKG